MPLQNSFFDSELGNLRQPLEIEILSGPCKFGLSVLDGVNALLISTDIDASDRLSAIHDVFTIVSSGLTSTFESPLSGYARVHRDAIEGDPPMKTTIQSARMRVERTVSSSGKRLIWFVDEDKNTEWLERFRNERG